MIAQELEVSLHMASWKRARSATNSSPWSICCWLCSTTRRPPRSCARAPRHRRPAQAPSDFVTEHTPILAGDDVDTQPTLGFQRVIQRAILHVQSSGKKEVTGANVLVAIFGEKDSHAVYFLHQKGVTRLDVVNFISHGISKVPQAQQAKTESDSETEHEAQPGGALENYTLNLNALACPARSTR
jgi:ATP-dependent Clp protease ATP-binding subunit ClpA